MLKCKTNYCELCISSYRGFKLWVPIERHWLGMHLLILKGSFYIAQYQVRWTAQSASQFLPFLTDLFISTPFSASLGSILAMQQLRATTKSLTFPPLSIARYSFIQLSRQGRQWREGKCPIFQMVGKGDSNPGSLDCKSGVLPLSYCLITYRGFVIIQLSTQ